MWVVSYPYKIMTHFIIFKIGQEASGSTSLTLNQLLLVLFYLLKIDKFIVRNILFICTI